MKVTYRKIRDAMPHVASLLNHSGLTGDLKLRCAAVAEEAEKHNARFGKQQGELIAKHDRNGELNLAQPSTAEERRAFREFDEQLGKMLDESVHFKFRPIPYEAIKGIVEPSGKKDGLTTPALSGGDLMRLSWLITLPDIKDEWVDDEEDEPKAAAASGD